MDQRTWDLDTAEVEVTFNQVDGQERTTSAARKLGSATKTAGLWILAQDP